MRRFLQQKFLHYALLTLGGVTSFGALGKSVYPPHGVCDGLPRIAVTTPEGFCVGLVAEGFRFPRGIQPLPNGDLVLVDMGGWDINAGSVWLLTKSGKLWTRKRLFDKLDRPNGIALGPDGLIYIGAVHRIFRFDPRAPESSLLDVIGGTAKVAPLPGIGRHLLTAMVFDRRGDLYVNVGSGSDHCEQPGGAVPLPNRRCPETDGTDPLAVIRKYTMRWPAGSVTSWTNHAAGLRNSMALAIHPLTGALWQGENSRDAIHLAMPILKNDEELPHDELNRIEQGAHFGWPYCYDNKRSSPEYPAWDCRKSRAPTRLLPAHAAPLGMMFYTDHLFPAKFANSLLIGFHGDRKYGHRIMALLPDKNGAPLGDAVELVSGWEAQADQPMGAPVAVRAAVDGSVFITEDRNGTVLRLSYHPPIKAPTESPGPPLPSHIAAVRK